MNLKKALFAAIFASAFGGVSIPAQAQVIVEVPLSDRYGYEVVPVRPGPGYAWQEGHWSWNGYRNAWVAGHWVRTYPIARLERDRDRDGVPDYADGDIDGDGIPNRLDRFPYDPYRS